MLGTCSYQTHNKKERKQDQLVQLSSTKYIVRTQMFCKSIILKVQAYNEYSSQSLGIQFGGSNDQIHFAQQKYMVGCDTGIFTWSFIVHPCRGMVLCSERKYKGCLKMP